MTTEAEMIAALDGHYWKMFVTAKGPKVVDINHEKPPHEERVVDERKNAGPHYIDWEKYDQILLQMRGAGAQYKEISRVLGINKDSLRWRFGRLCDVLGLDDEQEGPSFKKHSQEVQDQVVALRDKGMPFHKIGQQLGMSRASVCTLYYRWYRRNQTEAA